MKFMTVFLAFLFSINCFAFTQPDKKLTPGRVESKLTTAVVCAQGYIERTATIPAEVQKKVFARYGIAYPNPSVGIDNLVDQGVGGSQTDVRNLWPQDICSNDTAGKTCFGFMEKNFVDASLHQRVCAGQLSLAQAQAIDRGNWVAEFKRLTQAGTAQTVGVPVYQTGNTQYQGSANGHP